MTLADFGSIGEMVGGVGVVVSLLYLAIQIRQSSRLASLNAHQSISESLVGITTDVAKDPELYRIWRVVTDRSAEASEDDRERFGWMLHQIFVTFENADRIAEFDPSIGHRMRSIRDLYLRGPAVQEWWSRQKGLYSEPFRSKVDARARELASTTQAEANSSPVGSKATPP